MAEKLGAPMASATAYDPFAGPRLETTVPSTESQREIWTAAQLGPEASLAFNESISLEMRGTLDLAALRVSLGCAVAPRCARNAASGANSTPRRRSAPASSTARFRSRSSTGSDT